MAATIDPTTDPATEPTSGSGAAPAGPEAGGAGVVIPGADRNGSRAYDLWRAAWLPLSRSPRWFPLLPRVQRRELQACRAGDQLVIEGFPRSGNTFAVQAFLSVNPGVQVSHHMHAPANVLRALERGVPAVVVMRSPRDAVTSEVIREPRKSVVRALREWLSFYETVRPYADRLVLAEFGEVVTDLGAVIDRVNQRWATAFVPYEHGPEADRAVLAGIEARARARGKEGARLESQVPRPSASRDEVKRRVDARFAARSAARLLVQAEALHLGLRAAGRSPRPQ